MLLYHQTNFKGLLGMLKDGKMKPSSMTNNTGQSPYGNLPYIFFNTIPNKYIEELPCIVIIFDSSVLLNKTFYTYKSHAGGNVKYANKYKLDDEKEINKALLKLYKSSYNRLKKDAEKEKYYFPMWQMALYQEIFTRMQPKIKDVKYIILPDKKAEKTFFNNTKTSSEKTTILINEKYPDIQILYQHFKDMKKLNKT